MKIQFSVFPNPLTDGRKFCTLPLHSYLYSNSYYDYLQPDNSNSTSGSHDPDLSEEKDECSDTVDRGHSENVARQYTESL